MLPAVGLLRAIAPDPDRPDNEILTYPRLNRALERHKPIEESLLNTFYGAEDQSTEQLAAAHKLAEYELIETACQLQHAQSEIAKQELSAEFTTASVNLFGAPDPTIASYLLEQLLIELCVLQTNYRVDASLLEHLLKTYGDILGQAAPPSEYWLPLDEPMADEAARVFGDFLHERYASALAVFGGNPTQWVSAAGIIRRFEAGLDALKAQDILWNDWDVLVANDSCLSVNPLNKRLVVGMHRASVELGELKGLFGHEVLVHALRASNGEYLSEEFEQGLPGYIDAEEGFGCFVEHALSGDAPQKMYDRYLDVALALGTLDGRPRARFELFELVRARNTVRAQAASKTENPDNIRRESWAHVNRIFRGTLGNDIVGVFTKDIAYYQGYQKIGAFIVDELEMGTSIEEIWSLLTIGKYDPTDAAHMFELVSQS